MDRRTSAGAFYISHSAERIEKGWPGDAKRAESNTSRKVENLLKSLDFSQGGNYIFSNCWESCFLAVQTEVIFQAYI